MIIDLHPDMEEIITLGEARQRRARAKGRINPHVDGGIEDGYMRDLIGVKGEFAVARALGIEPDITRANAKGDPDPGYDGIYRGMKYEAKGTPSADGHLAYNPRFHKFRQDIWILAVRFDGDWIFRVPGWRWRSEMAFYWEECHFDAEAFCIHQDDLRPIAELLRL